MSWYPPGVTGAEMEIAGPDWEHSDEERTCSECDYEGKGEAWGYGHTAEWTCPECGHVEKFDPVEEDFWERADYEYDARRDRDG